MFNFTSAEKKAIMFTIIILLVSGLYQLLSPGHSLKPVYDYTESDSIFKRLSHEEINPDFTLSVDSVIMVTPEPKKKKTNNHTPKKQLLPASVNINTAPASELQKLPRIGPVKAKLIIEYRETHGNFKHIEDLIKVKGIGKKTLEKLKPFVLIE